MVPVTPRAYGHPMEQRLTVGGPYFDDLKVGDVFDDAPAVTLTEAHAVAYQAAFGDRMRLPLDATSSRAVTGSDRPVIHPLLVCHLSIGQTTTLSQRVRGNLFYRRLILRKQVHVGDTLRTRSEVAGLTQNRSRSGRAATGMVAMRTLTVDQHGDPVLDYWRCPMLPLREQIDTGHADDLDEVPSTVTDTDVLAAVPDRWNLDRFPSSGRAPRHGVTYVVESRETVTSALEIAHLTLNIASAHADPAASAYGRRLVYGGHTISVAFAQATRALPDLITILAWHTCEHLAPVFEGDLLRTEITVHTVEPLDEAAVLTLTAHTFAETPGEPDERIVLAWRFSALHAAVGA